MTADVYMDTKESTNLNAVPRIPDMTGAIPGELKGDRSGDRQNSTNTGKVLARPKNVSGTRFQPANDETGFTPVSDLDPGVTNPTDEMDLRVIDPSGHSKKPMEDALIVDADDDLSRIRRRVSYDKWTSSDRQESSKQSSNLTAAETPGAPVNATHRRLSRKPLNACTLCKAAHKKCDRKAPCSYCVSIGGGQYFDNLIYTSILTLAQQNASMMRNLSFQLRNVALQSDPQVPTVERRVH